jgi:hypothetical protein
MREDGDGCPGLMEVPLIYPVLLFVFCIASGIAFIWNIGGLATRMRASLERDPKYVALFGRLPWLPRAFFGAWCIVFGIGQLIYFYGFTHGKWG